jgi:hypothetical protein
VFFVKPETVRKHLLELCQFRVYEGGGTVYDLRGRRRGKRQKARDQLNPFWVVYPYDTPIRHIKTVYEWLNKYEIIVTNISIHDSDTMEAVDFASFLPVAERIKLTNG